MSAVQADKVLAVRYWKFSPSGHAEQRWLERVQPVVGHDRPGDFCRECRWSVISCCWKQ